MKKIVCSLLFCAFVFMVYAAPKPDKAFWEMVFKGVKTRIALHVVDEDGVAVSDVNAHFVFSRVEKYDEKNAVTDRDGNCVVENLTCGNSIEVRLSKVGYYDSSIMLCYIRMGNVHGVKDDKWQPYPTEKTVVLRKIRNPIPMIKCSDVFTIPTTNKWVGFDFELKDWTAPYGKGRLPDIEAFFTWDGNPPMSSKFVRLDVRFSGAVSGCYFADKIVESKFNGVYNAVTNDCYGVGELAFYSDIREGRHDVKKFDFSKVLVVRTRCKLDDAGDIVSANYSTIRAILVDGGWDGHGEMTLRYYYNPMSNDTNLEPKR